MLDGIEDDVVTWRVPTTSTSSPPRSHPADWQRGCPTTDPLHLASVFLVRKVIQGLKDWGDLAKPALQ